MRNPSLFAVLLLVLGAQACGLKGPLYLPEPAKEVNPAAEEKQDEEKQKKKAEQPASPDAPQEQQR